MHPRQQCPARHTMCHYCGKKSHFNSVCRSKHVNDISDNNSDTISNTGELSFLNTVSSEVAVVQGGSQPWIVALDLNSGQTEYKIDIGADVTVIPEHVYNRPLSSSNRMLRGPSRHSLHVLGKFLATLQKNQSQTR